MRILIRAWHSPYIFNLARALPEHTFNVLPTPYAPEGWLWHQRPQPANVELHTPRTLFDPQPDVFILQNGYDMLLSADIQWRGPALFLAHNHADLENGVVFALDKQRVPVVAISEMKAQSYRDAGYAHPIAVVPPGLPPTDYGGWTGKEPCVLTVCNNIRRPLFDLDAWIDATHGLPTLLVGEGNEGIPGAMGPAKSWDELKGFYRDCRVYLNPTCPPYEDPYNLALLEARATGTPYAGLGQYDGFAGDSSGDDVRTYLKHCLDGKPTFSDTVRVVVAEEFPWETFCANWRRVLEEVCG